MTSRLPATAAVESLQSPRHDDARPLRLESTARALIIGCGIGVVLAAGNVYTGLKTAFIDGGSITRGAARVHAVRDLQAPRAQRPYGALENNITQTTAVVGGDHGLRRRASADRSRRWRSWARTSPGGRSRRGGRRSAWSASSPRPCCGAGWWWRTRSRSPPAPPPPRSIETIFAAAQDRHAPGPVPVRRGGGGDARDLVPRRAAALHPPGDGRSASRSAASPPRR